MSETVTGSGRPRTLAEKVWDDHVSSLSKLRDVLRYMVSPVHFF